MILTPRYTLKFSGISTLTFEGHRPPRNKKKSRYFPTGSVPVVGLGPPSSAIHAIFVFLFFVFFGAVLPPSVPACSNKIVPPVHHLASHCRPRTHPPTDPMREMHFLSSSVLRIAPSGPGERYGRRLDLFLVHYSLSSYIQTVTQSIKALPIPRRKKEGKKERKKEPLAVYQSINQSINQDGPK